MKMSDKAHQFLSETQVCVLATTGPGNSPHAVPMWYRYRDGVITITTWRESQKCRNVERTGRAMVVVDRRDPPLLRSDGEGRRGGRPGPEPGRGVRNRFQVRGICRN